VAVITGAQGGMGRSAARLLGRGYDLVLTDSNGPLLDDFVKSLRDEGYTVAAAIAGDLAQPAAVEALARAAEAAGKLGALVHTAGLSPALAGWEDILTVNVVATVRLVAAFEPLLEPGAAAVLLASMAGHMAPAVPEIDAILAQPLDEVFLARMRPYLEKLNDPTDVHGLGNPAYALSKRAVIRLCEALAPAWGAKGARIISISPGTIWTPMGRREAETNPAAAAVVHATPMQRWGTPGDIANAIEFLVSDRASFITGCDLRVDGGVTPALAGVTF
jgi:NAD(P)-dependent dehydrogenase (short-subunit alcohol dehydrogenase family)